MPTEATGSRDVFFMAEALELAGRGWLTTQPNPRVGCVIVRGDTVVGRGFHRLAGGPHAEIEALEEAGGQARGATVYVTLEPCVHAGRTPPCAPALARAGVSRVVYAVADPNPVARGGGLWLEKAGIATTSDVLARAAREINRGFFKRHEMGCPWVTLKLASSLDGRTALASGKSRWITGSAARADVRRLRAGTGAVVTGSGTVLADNPRLSVRVSPGGDPGSGIEPLRVVLDSSARTPPHSRVFAPPAESLLVTAPEADARRHESAGIAVARVARGLHGLDLREVLTLLARREINELLVEAGPRLAGSWVQDGFVDEWWLYLAPCLLGPDARPLVDLPRLEALTDASRWRITDLRRVGADLRLILRPVGTTN
jgi:diaminohydroxyphosphoribosylaminopyrimidine deaminase/5-amino-6-(5-phosphoribosylamino)uracil reductase